MYANLWGQRISVYSDMSDSFLYERAIGFWVHRQFFKLIECLESIDNSAKNCVFQIEGRLGGICDEEL